VREIIRLLFVRGRVPSDQVIGVRRTENANAQYCTKGALSLTSSTSEAFFAISDCRPWAPQSESKMIVCFAIAPV